MLWLIHIDSNQFTFRIPPSLPSGQYLVRGEQIALHSKWLPLIRRGFPAIPVSAASSYGGAQFYIGCAQVNVENGGNGYCWLTGTPRTTLTHDLADLLDLSFPSLEHTLAMSLAF